VSFFFFFFFASFLRVAALSTQSLCGGAQHVAELGTRLHAHTQPPCAPHPHINLPAQHCSKENKEIKAGEKTIAMRLPRATPPPALLTPPPPAARPALAPTHRLAGRAASLTLHATTTNTIRPPGLARGPGNNNNHKHAGPHDPDTATRAGGGEAAWVRRQVRDERVGRLPATRASAGEWRRRRRGAFLPLSLTPLSLLIPFFSLVPLFSFSPLKGRQARPDPATPGHPPPAPAARRGRLPGHPPGCGRRGGRPRGLGPGGRARAARPARRARR